MARTKNDWLFFNGARPVPNDLQRQNWFEEVYFPFLLMLYLVLTRGARLDSNAARVQVREAAKGMLVKRRHQWQVWKRSLMAIRRPPAVPRHPPAYGPGF